jgi:hypothetical protein
MNKKHFNRRKDDMDLKIHMKTIIFNRPSRVTLVTPNRFRIPLVKKKMAQ